MNVFTRSIAVALILFPAAGPARAQPATAPTPAAPAQPERNIAGPGDYGLREKIVQLLGRDKDMTREKFRLILVNGGAVFSGVSNTRWPSAVPAPKTTLGNHC